jgi:hypothetical protein
LVVSERPTFTFTARTSICAISSHSRRTAGGCSVAMTPLYATSSATTGPMASPALQPKVRPPRSSTASSAAQNAACWSRRSPSRRPSSACGRSAKAPKLRPDRPGRIDSCRSRIALSTVSPLT